MYRVWTVNANNTVSCTTDWMSRANCKRNIIGRWGHWPPWAYISSAKSSISFKRYHQMGE